MSNSLTPKQPVQVVRMEHNIQITDPKLARQLRQYLANNGGGDFGEQLVAKTRSSAVGAVEVLLIIMAFLFGGPVLYVLGMLALYCFAQCADYAANNSPQVNSYVAPSPTPIQQIEVRRALPAHPLAKH